jgi:hypothetical protein
MTDFDVLDSFSEFLEENPTTENLSIESKMILFSRKHLTVEEAVGFGEQIIFVLGGMFADYLEANEDLDLETALGNFCLDNHLSPDMSKKFVSDLLEAAADDDDDDDEDGETYEEDSQEALEAKVRLFLAKLYGSVPDSFRAYFDLKGKFTTPEPYGNDWAGGVKGFDRHKHRFGHTAQDQDDDRDERWPSVYQGYPVVSVSEDADMLLAQPSGAAGDPGSGWLDASLATHGHYGDKVPDDAASKNVQGLKGGGTKPFKHGLMVPHHAVPETEAEAARNGFAIRIAKVHGNHTHITTEHPEHADRLADHIGELYGRLAVHRYTITPTPAQASLYKRSDLAISLEKKPTVKQKRLMGEAIALLEKSKPNTFDTTSQTMSDKIEADKNQYKHPDDEAGQREATLR